MLGGGESPVSGAQLFTVHFGWLLFTPLASLQPPSFMRSPDSLVLAPGLSTARVGIPVCENLGTVQIFQHFLTLALSPYLPASHPTSVSTRFPQTFGIVFGD